MSRSPGAIRYRASAAAWPVPRLHPLTMIFRVSVFLVLVSATGLAQLSTFPDRTYFKEQWQPAPLGVEIEFVEGIRAYNLDGTIEVDLDSYIELVMRNNPDINLQKLSILEQENAITRSLSPFDPTVQANFTSNRSTTPSNDVLQGADVRTNLTQRGGFTLTKFLDTGTTYSAGYTGVKNANNSQFTNFNPSITSNLNFTVQQELLRGRGRRINRIPVLIAESRLDLTVHQVRERVMQLLVQAETAYWNAVNSRETLAVRENFLQLSKANLDRQRRELELGAISPLDIYQIEQQYANAQVQVTTASYRYDQDLNEVRRWIGADLDPDTAMLPIELTESADPPSYVPKYDPEESVELALRLRPEVEQQRQTIEINDLGIERATNQMRPNLTLSGNYSAQGRGGNFFERSLTGTGSDTFVPGGFTDAIDQLFRFRFPTYGFGLTLRLPLRNRAAAADLADSVIAKRRALYNQRSIEQQVRLDVLNAIAGVELSRAAIQQASVALDFSRKRLDAEQKKYDLGVTTNFFVLQAQQDLVQAQADLLAQSIAYRRSILTLLRSTGELLAERGVRLASN